MYYLKADSEHVPWYVFLVSEKILMPTSDPHTLIKCTVNADFTLNQHLDNQCSKLFRSQLCDNINSTSRFWELSADKKNIIYQLINITKPLFWL